MTYFLVRSTSTFGHVWCFFGRCYNLTKYKWILSIFVLTSFGRIAKQFRFMDWRCLPIRPSVCPHFGVPFCDGNSSFPILCMCIELYEIYWTAIFACEVAHDFFCSWSYSNARSCTLPFYYAAILCHPSPFRRRRSILLCTCRSVCGLIGMSVSRNLMQLITYERFAKQASNSVGR